MISDTAIDALDELVAKGLRPSPRDVVRFNAIGLRLEAANGKNVRDSMYLLPRVAAVSDSLFFRQPAIGHEIWLSKVERFVKPGDYETMLALNAYALSRAPADLPDAESPDAVTTAVEAFLPTCRDLTRDQIYAALDYARNGADPAAGESPARPKTDEDDAGEADPDWRECVAVGVLNEGRAVLWGITEADMLKMTTRELATVIRRAYEFHNLDSNPDVDFWQGRFYATLDEIEQRLIEEKTHGSRD